MLAVFGLGNPGKRYLGTRHNVGFSVVDRLAEGLGVGAFGRRFQALTGDARGEAGKVLLVKPQTYMNESGRSVRAVTGWYDIAIDNILVICDDLDLERGRIRARREGSSGGHNGLKSVAEHLGTTAFPRLRVGIGRPAHGDAIDYVLSPFGRGEQDVVAEAVERAADAARCWMDEGIEACMNRFN